MLGVSVDVRCSQQLTLHEAASLSIDALVIGPGPGSPRGVGVCAELICHFGGDIPVLGVCLGHQCLGEVHGARVVRARTPRHGKTSLIHHEGGGVFSGLPNPFEATRYHSLVLDPSSLPEDLEVTATSDDGEIMGIRHKATGVEGVQFHPESVLTRCGMLLLENFLTRDGRIQVETA